MTAAQPYAILPLPPLFCVWKIAVRLDCHSSDSIHIFLDRVSHWPGTYQKGRLAGSGPQGPSRLSFPSTETAILCLHAKLFIWVLGHIQVLILAMKAF